MTESRSLGVVVNNKQNFSLVSFDTGLQELSKAATELLQVIKDVTGFVLEPAAIRRTAKANRDARILEAKTDVEVARIRAQVLDSLSAEEVIKYCNASSILLNAASKVSESAPVRNIDPDWLLLFVDKAKLITDVQMQELWARVLAGEAAVPGSFSKRTVEFLRTLNADDARAFSLACRFAPLLDGEPWLFVYYDNIGFYKEHDLEFWMLSHLDDIGLIRFDYLGGGFTARIETVHAGLVYGGSKYEMRFPVKFSGELSVGSAILTRSGRELHRLVEHQAVDGFCEYVFGRWKRQCIDVTRVD
ncbi:MAG: DUF2806 domain-containing protein [Phycisphaerales bacterium]|nr:MAG: DUF2806 domain-containing protein [Phycisphaerales bacterium]